jgi:predicted dehydrogenase
MAQKFIRAIDYMPLQKVIAVYSRKPKQSFEITDLPHDVTLTNEFEWIVNNPRINAVYIATPLKYHYEFLKNSLINEKSVICEKPLLETFEQYLEIESIMKAKNLLLVEGNWTQFLEFNKIVEDILSSNIIGYPILFNSEFNRKYNLEYKNRILDKELGGGTFNEMSIYGITLCLNLFGEPRKYETSFSDFFNGVDLESKIIMKYEKDLTAKVQCSFTNDSTTFTRINCSLGSIQWGDILKGENYIQIENFDNNSNKKIFFENRAQHKMLQFFEKHYYSMNHDFNLSTFSKSIKIGRIMCAIREQKLTH